MANESKIATKWYINELKIATIYKPNLNLSTFPKKKTLSEKLISVKISAPLCEFDRKAVIKDSITFHSRSLIKECRFHYTLEIFSNPSTYTFQTAEIRKRKVRILF